MAASTEICHDAKERVLALEIPEVLSMVFSFLPTNDLFSCRRVCRLWNSQSIYHLKRKRDISVTICDKIARNYNHDLVVAVPAYQNLLNFVKVVSTSEKMGLMPSSWFDIVRLRFRCVTDAWDRTGLEAEDKKMVKKAWRFIGRRVRHLTISRQYFYPGILPRGAGEAVVLSHQIIPSGVSFEKLQTFKYYSDYPDRSKSLSKMAEQVIESAPVLEALELLDIGSAIFRKCIMAANPSSLRTLSISRIGETPLSEKWWNGEIRLTRLAFDGEYFLGQSNNAVQSIIEHQRNGLQELRLRECKNVRLGEICLPALVSLSLYIFFHGFACKQYPERQQQMFPRLKKLILCHQIGLKRFFRKCGQMATVTEFGLYEYECRSDHVKGRVLCKNLNRLFPNLSTLEIRVSVERLVQLVGSLKNLKHLILHSYGHTDTRYIINLDRALSCRGGTVSERLQNLQNLQTLRIIKNPCPTARHSISLSEATCCSVLLEMKELKELDFGGHHYTGNKISTKVIMKMMNKFKLSGMNLSWVSE